MNPNEYFQTRATQSVTEYLDQTPTVESLPDSTGVGFIILIAIVLVAVAPFGWVLIRKVLGR